MKKTYPLTSAGKDDARVRDKVRHEVNKFLKRARQRELPEGMRYWNFDCRCGESEATAVPVGWKEIGAVIDQQAEAGAGSVFIEIRAVAEARVRA